MLPLVFISITATQRSLSRYRSSVLTMTSCCVGTDGLPPALGIDRFHAHCRSIVQPRKSMRHDSAQGRPGIALQPLQPGARTTADVSAPTATSPTGVLRWPAPSVCGSLGYLQLITTAGRLLPLLIFRCKSPIINC